MLALRNQRSEVRSLAARLLDPVASLVPSGRRLFGAPSLRDLRRRRDFRRPWIDPPGYGAFGPCGCNCSSVKTTGPSLIQTVCCANALPQTLHATFSNSGACAAFDGGTFPLTYTTAPRLNFNFSVGRWEYVATNTSTCEEAIQFFCTYDPGFTPCGGNTGCKAYRLNVPAFGCSCQGFLCNGGTAHPCSCSPLSIVFSNVQFLPPNPANNCSDCTDDTHGGGAQWATVAVTF